MILRKSSPLPPFLCDLCAQTPQLRSSSFRENLCKSVVKLYAAKQPLIPSESETHKAT